MKEKIQLLVATLKKLPHQLKKVPAPIWGFCGLMLLVMGSSGWLVMRAFHPHSPQDHDRLAHLDSEHSELAADSPTESENGHGGASIIAANPLPREVLDAQDGVPEPDHDLVESPVEESRGIASVLQQDLTVSTGRRFVNLDEVMGATSATKGVLAHVFIELALEVKDRETQERVQARVTELKSLVASQVSEYTKDQLKTTDGQMQLKSDLMTEMNHLVQGGVDDVLFTKLTVR